jgi:hypothetical protein
MRAKRPKKGPKRDISLPQDLDGNQESGKAWQPVLAAGGSLLCERPGFSIGAREACPREKRVNCGFRTPLPGMDFLWLELAPYCDFKVKRRPDAAP